MEEPPAAIGERVWNDWRLRFQAHLDSYGYAVYNLDFVNPVPADDPAPLFDTLKFYLRGQGQNPHERQRRMVRRREEATKAVLERLDPARGRMIGRLLRWAQDAAPVREDALADTGLAWPVMRRMLLELGRRLVEAKAVEKPADVFWLRQQELEDITSSLEAGETQLASLAESVEQRKMLWRGQRRVTPPQLLPKASWFKVFEGLMPAASEDQTGDTIKGIAASGGQVTAAARVLAGPGLFAMASAVVTDVGGPLSHSSIVAREYGIPAVLGTGVATRRIRSEQNIRVDGDAGTVMLLNRMGRDDGGRPAEAAPSRPIPQRRQSWRSRPSPGWFSSWLSLVGEGRNEPRRRSSKNG
jgi:hypothetical protein